MAVQFSTWSRAFRRPSRSNLCGLRCNGHILGLPNDLDSSARARLTAGSLQMSRVARIARICYNLGNPCALENPVAALSWSAPPTARLCKSEYYAQVFFDQRQSGFRWRRRATIFVCHCSNFGSLNSSCRGKRGDCARADKAHIALTGKCSQN